MTRPNPALREKLVASAQALLLAKGYAATTIEQVCAAAGVTKGTLFHYFRSKDALAQAAFERFREAGAAAYRGAPFLAQRDPLERVLGYVDFTVGLCRHPVHDGCLVGMFSQELADTHPQMRTLCVQAFGQWADGLKAMLDEAKQRHAPRSRIDTQELAEHFIAVFEGALILAKAQNDVAPVRRHLEHFKRYLRAVFLDRPAGRARASR